MVTEHNILEIDGFGRRRIAADPDSGEKVEILDLAPSLVEHSAFVHALGERVARFASVRHTSYAHLRRLDRPAVERLELISDLTPGWRLSELLDETAAAKVPVDINVFIGLMRQLLPAVALYGRHNRDSAIGALAPERLLVTPQARLVIAEHAFGPSIEKLNLGRDRLWKDFRISMPPSTGLPKANARADAMGIGVIGLSVLLGRVLTADEFPDRLKALAESVQEYRDGKPSPITKSLLSWLFRALHIDPDNGFQAPSDAQLAFETVLISERSYVLAPAAFQQWVGTIGGRIEARRPVAPPAATKESEEDLLASLDEPVAPAASASQTKTQAPAEEDPIAAAIAAYVPRRSAAPEADSAKEAAAREAAAKEAAAKEAAAKEAAAKEAAAKEAAAKEAARKEAAAKEAAAKEAAAKEAARKEAAAKEAAAKEAAAKEAAAKEAAAKEAAAKEAAAKEAAAKEAAAKEAAAKEAAAKEAARKEAAAKEAAAKKTADEAPSLPPPPASFYQDAPYEPLRFESTYDQPPVDQPHIEEVVDEPSRDEEPRLVEARELETRGSELDYEERRDEDELNDEERDEERYEEPDEERDEERGEETLDEETSDEESEHEPVAAAPMFESSARGTVTPFRSFRNFDTDETPEMPAPVALEELDAPETPPALRVQAPTLFQSHQAPETSELDQRSVSNRPILLMAGAIVLLLAVIGWMWLRPVDSGGLSSREGELAVTTRIPGAALKIDGKDAGVTPATLRLAPGPHVLEVQIGSGEPRVVPVMIKPGVQTAQYVELQEPAPVLPPKVPEKARKR